ASIVEDILSDREGYISHIECDEIGVCSLILGGGRETKESEIDLSVGLVLRGKVGDFVKKGESIAVIHGNDRDKIAQAKERFLKAYSFSKSPVEKKPFIQGVITP
ncbi:MAG: pyrimidine-nucleoside phosphorylase, partial [Lachnospiraceae bacterium]|nr:pyrimidine-nucleoside phosphorylase [Lachnospiraceae bacterium]